MLLIEVPALKELDKEVNQVAPEQLYVLAQV